MAPKTQFGFEMPGFEMPGFRFYPTDQELLEFYLHKKVQHDADFMIRVIHLYQYDPWELQELASFGDGGLFFFVPRETTSRPSRVTKSGFWKASGTDKQILNCNKLIGYKKTLVFYCGRGGRAEKTEWIMSEYRMPDLCHSNAKQMGMTICKVYKKSGPGRAQISQGHNNITEEDECVKEFPHQIPGALERQSSSIVEESTEPIVEDERFAQLSDFLLADTDYPDLIHYPSDKCHGADVNTPIFGNM